MYNSPLAWCPIARCYVALDEPQAECVLRNQCVTRNCPLAPLFARSKNGAAATAEKAAGEDPLNPRPTKLARV
jgi:hypothetical protein